MASRPYCVWAFIVTLDDVEDILAMIQSQWPEDAVPDLDRWHKESRTLELPLVAEVVRDLRSKGLLTPPPFDLVIDLYSTAMKARDAEREASALNAWSLTPDERKRGLEAIAVLRELLV